MWLRAGCSVSGCSPLSLTASPAQSWQSNPYQGILYEQQKSEEKPVYTSWIYNGLYIWNTTIMSKQVPSFLVIRAIKLHLSFLLKFLRAFALAGRYIWCGWNNNNNAHRHIPCVLHRGSHHPMHIPRQQDRTCSCSWAAAMRSNGVTDIDDPLWCLGWHSLSVVGSPFKLQV